MRRQSCRSGHARGLWAGCLLWACLAAPMVAPRVAHAQQNAAGKAAAEALFDEGLKLLKDNKLEEACSRFEKSQGIDPAVGTLLYLAECYERTGRIASAWATFREAASGASAAGQTDRAQVGTDRARQLEAKLSRLTLNVGGNAAIVGFKVERDGQAVPAAVFGEPLPMDPGQHTLVASAPGYEPWRVDVSVPPVGGLQAISIPPLNPLPAPLPEPAAPPPQTEPGPAISDKNPPPKAQHEPDLTWAWISGGVGLVGVGAGVVFGMKASGLDADAKDFCEGTACFDQRGDELSADARDAALIANIGYGVGAVGLGTAVVLAIIAMQDDEPEIAASNAQPRWNLVPSVGHQGASLQMRGQF